MRVVLTSHVCLLSTYIYMMTSAITVLGFCFRSLNGLNDYGVRMNEQIVRLCYCSLTLKLLLFISEAVRARTEFHICLVSITTFNNNTARLCVCSFAELIKRRTYIIACVWWYHNTLLRWLLFGQHNTESKFIYVDVCAWLCSCWWLFWGGVMRSCIGT